MYSRPQKLVAEFWGTFAIVLFSAGTVCADQFLRGVNAGAPGAAAIGPLGIALAYGLAFASMNAALGHISGGHFNPAVTVGFWVTRRLSTFDSLTYWLAQLAGAAAAAYLLRAVIPDAVWQAVALGTPGLAGGLARSPAMIIEGLGAFFLTIVIFATSDGERGAAPSGMSVSGALAAGLAVTAGSLFAGPFTGGAMNPARAFGPALVTSHWTNQGIYWVGPLAGGMLAAWIFDTFLPYPKRSGS